MRRQTPALDNQFPSPLDRFFFEIIAKRPVAEHFKKRVVIGIVAHIFEIIVLATGADAFLRISGTWRIIGRFFHAEEIRHERIHARVGEEQSRRLRQQRGRRDNGVQFLTKEIKEALADLGGVHKCGWETITIRRDWQGSS